MGRRYYQYAWIDADKLDEPVTSMDIWYNYCDNTSAHGIPHIHKANGTIKKTFWSILSLVFLGALLLNMYTVIERFASYPVNVLISLENDEELQFPSITICNMSPVRLSKWNAYFNTTNSTESDANSTMTSPDVDTVTLPYDVTADDAVTAARESSSAYLDPFTSDLIEATTSATGVSKTRRKRDIQTITSYQMYCETGWTEVEGKCYQKFSFGQTFFNAKDSCAARNAELVIINSTEVQEYVETITEGESIWAGIYQAGSGWGFGGVNGPDPAYTNWKTPEPDGSGPCARADYAWNYQWMDKECSVNDYYAACSLDLTGSCPSRWQDSGVRCYAASNGTVAGHDGSSFCASLHPDATLARLDSAAEQAFATNNIFDGLHSFWIGIQLNEPEATWPDGSEVYFENWAPGQPAPVEGCLEILYTGLWVITECDRSLSYVCEGAMVNITIVEEFEEPEEDTCSCDCCGATSFVYAPPPVSENETVVVVKAMEAEPEVVEGSKFDRPVLNEDFAGSENLIEELSRLDDDTQRELGYSLEELVLDCQFEGSNCGYSEFAHFHNPVHGNCYIFSGGWFNTSIKKSKRTGKRHGLHLTINLDQDDYHPDAGDTAGIRVVVHTPDRMPFPQDEGITLGPGAATAVGLRQVTLNRKPHPYGDCIEREISNPEQNMYEQIYPVKYTVNACQKSCVQKAIVKHCGCADPSYPMAGEALKVPKCRSDNVTQGDCLFTLGRLIADEAQTEFACVCPNACEQILYEMDISTGVWPSDNKRDATLTRLAPQIPNLLNDPTDPSKYERNLMKLEIFYTEFNFEWIYEKPAYTISSLASDFGGVLGLWFGFSLLTIFEFIELYLDLFYYVCARWYGGKKRKEKLAAFPAGPTPPPRRRSIHDGNLDVGMFEPRRYSAPSDVDFYPMFHNNDGGGDAARLRHVQNGVRVLPPPYQGLDSKFARAPGDARAKSSANSTFYTGTSSDSIPTYF